MMCSFIFLTTTMISNPTFPFLLHNLFLQNLYKVQPPSKTPQYTPLSPLPTNKICLSIFCTPPPNKRPEPTSSSVLYRVQIASSWISSVQDAFKLRLFLAMHRQSSFADLAMLCYANLQVVGLDLPRDAHTERRLTKFSFCIQEKDID